MSYTSKRRTIGAGIVLAGLFTASGCAQEQEALIVLNAPRWGDSETCEVDTAAEGLLFGRLDLDFGTGYLMPAALQNQLVTTDAMITNSATDNGELQLVGADVVLRSSQAPELIDALSAENSAFVEFSKDLPSSSIPSSSALGVAVEVVSQAAAVSLATLVPSVLGEGAQPEIIADVIFLARRSGNKVGKLGEFESRTFSFPIQLTSLYSCAGCPDQQCPVGQPTSFIGGACGNAQDLLIGPAQCDDPNGN